MKISSYSLGLILLIACGQTKTSDNSIDTIKDFSQIDTSDYALMKYDSVEMWCFKNCKSADLSVVDIRNIEILLKDCIMTFNNDTAHKYNFDLSKYKLQYIAVTNRNSEKEVWVNAFCNSYGHNWRKEIITVDDGGKCYFNLKINLSTNKYYDFEVNGHA